METPYTSVGTLGDAHGLTSSLDAVRRWGGALRIDAYGSFEAAADDVRNRRLPAFVVPCAYPRLNAFIMDAALAVADTFMMTTRSLVLAGRTVAPPRAAATLYHHPATAPLIAELSSVPASLRPMDSNAEAARAAAADADGLAITNDLCATHYQLTIYRMLRPGIRMPFLCFVRAEEARSRTQYTGTDGDRGAAA